MSEAVAETGAAVHPPAPEADADSAFYWEGLRSHRFLLQECTECGRRRFPPMPSCPYCSSAGSRVIESSGRGTIYSWITVHRAFNPVFASDVPYTVLTVDLAEGARMAVRLAGDASDIKAGREVELVFVDHPDWTEARFRLA
jgi:uncharacterized protein